MSDVVRWFVWNFGVIGVSVVGSCLVVFAVAYVVNYHERRRRLLIASHVEQLFKELTGHIKEMTAASERRLKEQVARRLVPFDQDAIKPRLVCPECGAPAARTLRKDDDGYFHCRAGHSFLPDVLPPEQGRLVKCRDPDDDADYSTMPKNAGKPLPNTTE